MASGGAQAAVRQEPGAGPPEGLATCHLPALGHVRPVGRRAWKARAAAGRPQDANGTRASGLASACPLACSRKPPKVARRLGVKAQRPQHEDKGWAALRAGKASSRSLRWSERPQPPDSW